MLRKYLWRLNAFSLLIGRIGAGTYIRYKLARPGREIALEAFGLKLTVRAGTPDLNVAMSCLGGEFAILGTLFGRGYNGVIVDAGGYIGTAAIAFARLYPKARIITIEPSPENLALLRRNVAPFGTIEVVEGALSAESGKMIMLKDRGTGAWGFSVVDVPGDDGNSRVSALARVKTLRLEDLGVDIADIGILKLDIEGGEKELFDHEAETLRRIPAVLVELHDRIVEGCTKSFMAFSRNRWVIKEKGEKFLSLSRARKASRSPAISS